MLFKFAVYNTYTIKEHTITLSGSHLYVYANLMHYWAWEFIVWCCFKAAAAWPDECEAGSVYAHENRTDCTTGWTQRHPQESQEIVSFNLFLPVSMQKDALSALFRWFILMQYASIIAIMIMMGDKAAAFMDLNV